MRRPDIIARAPAVAAQFAMACAASRAHMALATAALETFGRHGPLVSGCVRSHFPEPVKQALRELARECGRRSDMARAARPRGMHASTVNRIACAIATRDGSGHYGPQPDVPGNALQAGLQLAWPGKESAE